MRNIDIIIDLEFTGLDNSFITDNEIIQLKMMNAKTRKSICVNFGSKKRILAHPFLSHKTTRYVGAKKFNKERFADALISVCDNQTGRIIYHGFGTKTDMLMLQKYGINYEIEDIREKLQRTRHEKRMATEGSNLEATFYIVTGRHPGLDNHDGSAELYIIHELYLAAKRLKKHEYLSVMPHGHCAGMPIEQYVDNYRRQADGYRFNNSDILSRSFNNAIETIDEN